MVFGQRTLRGGYYSPACNSVVQAEQIIAEQNAKLPVWAKLRQCYRYDRLPQIAAEQALI
jgi:hypothetical protein